MSEKQEIYICVWGKEGDVFFKDLKSYVLMEEYLFWECGKYFRKAESWLDMIINIQRKLQENGLTER